MQTHQTSAHQKMQTPGTGRRFEEKGSVRCCLHFPVLISIFVIIYLKAVSFPNKMSWPLSKLMSLHEDPICIPPQMKKEKKGSLGKIYNCICKAGSSPILLA